MRIPMMDCESNDLCLKLSEKTAEMFWFSDYCYFTPRQGTFLVAILELSMGTIALFLLLLAAMHTRDVAALAVEELKEYRPDWPTYFGRKFNLTFNNLNNEKKMLTGRNLAMVMVRITYAGVFLSLLHILCSLMLLSGVLYDIGNLLIPWLSLSLFSLVITSAFLLIVYLFLDPNIPSVYYLSAVPVYLTEIHWWFLVFRYYRSISKNNAYKAVVNVSSHPEVESV